MSEASTGRRGYGPGFWYVMLLMALAGYVGTYYALVEPLSVRLLINFQQDGELYASYAGNETANNLLSSFFRPIHLIDQKIRPDYWRWSHRKVR